MTTYTVRVVGADGSVGQGCTVCTTSPCLYVHQVTHVAVYYNIYVTSIHPDGTLGPQNSTTLGEWIYLRAFMFRTDTQFINWLTDCVSKAASVRFQHGY